MEKGINVIKVKRERQKCLNAEICEKQKIRKMSKKGKRKTLKERKEQK